jgi:hypothetical protein
METENILNKTMKHKTHENIFVSVRASNKKKSPKHFLTPTISSMNKKTQKFENTFQNPQSNMSKTSCPMKRKKSDMLLSKANSSFCKTLNYEDNLHHFTNNSEIGYDTYGHFS